MFAPVPTERWARDDPAQADMICDRLGSGTSHGRPHRVFLREKTLTGGAGAVKQLERSLHDVFIVINCDIVSDVDLTKILSFHKQQRALATIGFVEREDAKHYGVVVLNEHGRIIAFQEKPSRGTARSRVVNTGIYVFETEILDHIPANTFYDFGKDVFPHCKRLARRSTAYR